MGVWRFLSWFWYHMGSDLYSSWYHAAGACGLRVVSRSSTSFRSMNAESETVRARFTEISGDELLGTHITVASIKASRGGPTLAPENLWTRYESFRGSSDFEIGDAGFDQAFRLGGNPSRLLALLDAETRATLSTLHRQTRLQVRGGTVAVTYDESRLEIGLARMLAQMIAVAERWAAPIEVPRELAANARRDPVAPVRLQNLLALIREFPEHAGVADALAAARGDAVPEIRLRAAMAAGEAGREVLIALAGDAAIEDECAAAAIAALGRRLERRRVEEVLGSALRSRRLETAAACIDSLGTGGAPEAAVALRKVLAVEPGRLAVAAAQALAKVGTAGAEAALRDALARDLPELCVAVAEALGQVGSATAVPALRESAARHPDDRALQRAVRQAIAEIHSRLPGASPGQLTLAAAAAGQLSLATGGGELSFADAGAGQLSLGPSSTSEDPRSADATAPHPHPDRLDPSQ